MKPTRYDATPTATVHSLRGNGFDRDHAHAADGVIPRNSGLPVDYFVSRQLSAREWLYVLLGTALVGVVALLIVNR